MIGLRFAWYDLWIGAYWDRKKKSLYVCPLPTLVFQIPNRDAKTADPDPSGGMPEAVRHDLLRRYVVQQWPAETDPDRQARYLADDPIYGGRPALVAAIEAAYAAGQKSIEHTTHRQGVRDDGTV